jgi:cytochrome c553
METMKKLLLAVTLIASPAVAEDRFEDIRRIWPTCAGCHGMQGEGVAGMPALAGRDADYIITALLQYRNKEQRGPLSSLMWQQASLINEGQIGTIGVFVQEGFPEE